MIHWSIKKAAKVTSNYKLYPVSIFASRIFTRKWNKILILNCNLHMHSATAFTYPKYTIQMIRHVWKKYCLIDNTSMMYFTQYQEFCLNLALFILFSKTKCFLVERWIKSVVVFSGLSYFSVPGSSLPPTLWLSSNKPSARGKSGAQTH